MSFEMPDLAKVAAVFGTLGVVASVEGQVLGLRPWGTVSGSAGYTAPTEGGWFQEPSGTVSLISWYGPPPYATSISALAQGPRSNGAVSVASGATVVLASISAGGFDFTSETTPDPYTVTSFTSTVSLGANLRGVALTPQIEATSSAQSKMSYSVQATVPARLKWSGESRATWSASGQVTPASLRWGASLQTTVESGNPNSLVRRVSGVVPVVGVGRAAFTVVVPPGWHGVIMYVSASSEHEGAGVFEASATVNHSLSMSTACLADVAGVGGVAQPDGQLSADDLVVYLSAFLSGDRDIADIASIGGLLGSDDQVTADDLIAYLRLFIQGCP